MAQSIGCVCVSGGRNPTPGIVINHPQGKDVYGGVVIDYRHKVDSLLCYCISKCSNAV